MIEKVKKQVYELLEKDKSGHGIDHIERVLNLTLKFAKEENANVEIATLIALLHDVDDYKLFGVENSLDLSNAKRIMNKANVNEDIKNQVLSEIKRIGYSKRLKGISPKTIEGKIVSDADMNDALGSNGIIRTYTYSLQNNRPFFDKEVFPNLNMNAQEYMSKCSNSSVCHIFEKILKLKELMLTDAGKTEAEERDKIVVDFLYHLFDEDNAREWKDYLNNYLKER